MEAKEFREFGRAAIDYVADYLENIRDRDVLPSVKPGYLRNIIENHIPENGENWKDILKDINEFILPGVTHWQSPNFHAYYPTATSFPSIIGEIFSAGFAVVGFSWITSPACTELEAIVMDWIGKFLNLPKLFLNSTEGPGGGIIQGSASEAVLVALLTARERAVRRILEENPQLDEGTIRGKLVAYSSDQSNSCVEKAGILAAVPIKLISTEDDNLILTGESLKMALQKDLDEGKIPIICIATLGTTGTCAFDDIPSLAKTCKKYNVWLHIDAAYAGMAFSLPEYCHLLKGLDEVESINYNLHKSMLVNFDCCAMWFKNVPDVVESFNVNRIYLKHDYEGCAPDYRHWQIPLGRRFRSLKVWLTLRTIGAEGFRKCFRFHFKLAEIFENYIISDDRFEMVTPRSLGLVCFRMKGENELTKELLNRITERKKIYIIQASHKEKIFLRFVICGYNPLEKDVHFAWEEISTQANEVLRNKKNLIVISAESMMNMRRPEIKNITEKLSKNLLITREKEQ